MNGLAKIRQFSLVTLFVLAISGCVSPPLNQDFTYPTDAQLQENQALLIFVLPPQHATFYGLDSVDISRAQQTNRSYTLGDLPQHGSRLLRIDPQELDKDLVAFHGADGNFIGLYGIQLVEAGDYAVTAHWGGVHEFRCLADNSPVFRVAPGTINILDALPSLAMRGGNRNPAAVRTIETLLPEYIATALSRFPGISGDIELVTPLGVADFGPPTEGFFGVPCASNDYFELLSFRSRPNAY